MASDNKADTTPTENTNTVSSKAADSSGTANPKKVPPVLNDTVAPAADSSKPESKANVEPEKKPAPSVPKQKKSATGVAWLALLIALLALAGVAFGLWTQQQGKQAETLQENHLNQRQGQLLEDIQSSTQNLSGQVKAVISQSEIQQRTLGELQTQLQASNRQLGEITQVSRRSWMLAEAEYLLRLANQRLLMERETTSALTLLHSADQILVTVAEPGLFQVRESLAREVAALRAVAHLDVEGIFVKLAALGVQVETLALLTPENEAPMPDSDANIIDEEKGGKVLSSALAHFSDMVTLRHRDEPVQPLLTPEQHFYVQQNLRLMLEQAQLALLQRQASIYSLTLNKAEGWVQEYFQLNANTQALLASLRELQQVNVDPQLPDISASLGLLKAYLTQPVSSQQSVIETGAVR